MVITPVLLFFYLVAVAGGLAVIGVILLFLFACFLAILGGKRPAA